MVTLTILFDDREEKDDDYWRARARKPRDMLQADIASARANSNIAPVVNARGHTGIPVVIHTKGHDDRRPITNNHTDRHQATNKHYADRTTSAEDRGNKSVSSQSVGRSWRDADMEREPARSTAKQDVQPKVSLGGSLDDLGLSSPE